MGIVFILAMFVEGHIFSHYSGYFWHILFVFIALCRYSCNSNIPMLAAGFIGTVVILYSPHPDRFNILLVYQSVLMGIDFLYNIYNRNWRRDPVFVFLEPVLMVALLSYFTDSTPATDMMRVLHKWIGVYIVLEFTYWFWIKTEKLREPVLVAGVRFLPPHEEILENFIRESNKLFSDFFGVKFGENRPLKGRGVSQKLKNDINVNKKKDHGSKNVV